MKKHFLLILVALLWCNVGVADGIKELNNKLLEIEKRMDTCLGTKDKDMCEKFILENPILSEILGNVDFAKLSSSSKCEIGTKCYSSMARIAAKTFQISDLLMELD